jgi:multidrug resistance protein, MATE family
LSLLAIPITLSWFYVETIFLQLGVSPAICVVMKHFLRIRALAIPSELVSQSYQKYLMSIGVTSPSLVGTVALIIFVFLFNFVFVHHFHGGYESLAWGFVVAKYLSDISIVLVSLREEPVQLTLQPFHWSALTNWWEFIELGLPGCAMLCSEWWAFEILCIFASRLGSNEVAAQTIIGQLSSLSYMIPLGLGVTASSFVGQYLGSQEPSTAIRYAYTSFGCLVFAELVICPSIYFFSPYFVGIFTTDPGVIEICVHVSHIIAIFTFADGAQGVLSGIYRGAGKQFYGAVVNFLSYYCLGLPLAWHLTFHTSMGVAGLMTGIASAVISQTVIFLSILCFRQDTLFASVLSPSELTSEGKKQFVELGEWSDEMDQSSHSMLAHGGDDIEASQRV